LGNLHGFSAIALGHAFARETYPCGRSPLPPSIEKEQKWIKFRFPTQADL
jgi:hypothetical protein